MQMSKRYVERVIASPRGISAEPVLWLVQAADKALALLKSSPETALSDLHESEPNLRHASHLAPL